MRSLRLQCLLFQQLLYQILQTGVPRDDMTGMPQRGGIVRGIVQANTLCICCCCRGDSRCGILCGFIVACALYTPIFYCVSRRKYCGCAICTNGRTFDLSCPNNIIHSTLCCLLLPIAVGCGRIRSGLTLSHPNKDLKEKIID